MSLRITLTILLLLFTVRPALADDPAMDFSLSNGMKVIFLPVTDNEVVALEIIMPGTSLRQTRLSAGFEKVLLTAMTKGSLSYPGERMDREVDRYGSSIHSSAGKDFSTYGMSCVRPFFFQTLKVLADSFRHPELDPAEVERVRMRQLAQVRAMRDNPDQFLSLVLNDSFYRGHPYHYDVEGTEKSLSGISLDSLKGLHARLIRQSSSFLVVVGNFDKRELTGYLEAAFGDLDRDRVRSSALPRFSPHKDEMIVSDRKLPTRYILAKFDAPSPDHPDYPALKLGLKLLSDRLWEEVRTKRGLTYAVYSGLSSNLTNFGYLYLTTVNESEAVPLLFAEIERIKKEPVPEDELTAAKAVFQTQYYMSIESNSGQGSHLASGEIYLGDYRRRNETMEKIGSVKAADILKITDKYLSSFLFAVLGNEEGIDRAAFTRSKKAELSETKDSAEALGPKKGEK